MEKNRFLKIVIVCLLMLNLGILSFLFITRKDGKRTHHNRGEEGPAKFIIEQLGFDEKQIAGFNDLKNEHQRQMSQLQDSIKLQREMLPDLIVEGNDAKADSVTTSIGSYQKKIEYNTYVNFVKVRNLCN